MLITPHFERYKEASRGLWNTYFLENGRSTWENREIFNEIEKLLFDKIVLIELGLNRTHIAEGDFKVVARDSGRCLPMMVNRTGDGGYWDHPVTELIDDEYDIDFIEYFDFDQLSYKDNRYVIVRINSSKLHPEITGHKAMIESQYADFLYLRSAQQGDSPEPAAPAR